MSKLHHVIAGCTAATLVTFSGAGLAPDRVQEEEGSQVVTLYANDDLLSSYSFRLAAPGGFVERGEIVLDDAQIAFHVLADGMISFGFVRDERVNVIDLGALYVPEQTRARDRAPKFALSVFHTLFLDGAQVSYLGAGGNVFRLGEANRILGPLPSEGLYHVEPRLGHTYLLRAKQRGVGASDEIVKFQVIDLVPGVSLTIRWAHVGSR